MRAVCLKHVPFEGPGAFATALTARGVSLERYLVPTRRAAEGCGRSVDRDGWAMSVNDPDPWIAEETLFIRSVLLSRHACHRCVPWKPVHGEIVGCHQYVLVRPWKSA